MSTENKRRLSSDGKTLKPRTKATKITDQRDKSEWTELLDPMTVIAQALRRLQKGQTPLQPMIEGKLNKFRNTNFEHTYKPDKALHSSDHVNKPLDDPNFTVIATNLKFDKV